MGYTVGATSSQGRLLAGGYKCLVCKNASRASPPSAGMLSSF